MEEAVATIFLTMSDRVRVFASYQPRAVIGGSILAGLFLVETLAALAMRGGL